MKSTVRFLVATLMLLWVGSVWAQLLPINDTLNAQSVQRWMNSNRALAPLVAVVDGRLLTSELSKSFESMSDLQQDEYITQVLDQEQLSGQAAEVLKTYGWASLGEYMRLSARLGNAIAAYFVLGDVQQLSADQLAQLKQKTDPAILAVPDTDIEFVRRNEKALQRYIQAYAGN